MERIVLGISAINFSNSSEFISEKTAVSTPGDWPNETFPCTMSTAEVVESPDEDEFLEETSVPSTSSSTSASTSASTSSSTYRRTLPARMAKCKENSVLRIKRRSIMKPRRNFPGSEIKMRPSDIKKMYLENKIKGNFRPSNLETIFEEPTPDNNEQLCFIGAKKIRRSLSCSDGLNVTKTTVKSRRMKIKKTFGRRFALKKISLEDFIVRLNSSFEETPEEPESTIPTEDEAIKTDGDVGESEMECADDTLFLT